MLEEAAVHVDAYHLGIAIQNFGYKIPQNRKDTYILCRTLLFDAAEWYQLPPYFWAPHLEKVGQIAKLLDGTKTPISSWRAFAIESEVERSNLHFRSYNQIVIRIWYERVGGPDMELQKENLPRTLEIYKGEIPATAKLIEKPKPPDSQPQTAAEIIQKTFDAQMARISVNGKDFYPFKDLKIDWKVPKDPYIYGTYNPPSVDRSHFDPRMVNVDVGGPDSTMHFTVYDEVGVQKGPFEYGSKEWFAWIMSVIDKSHK